MNGIFVTLNLFCFVICSKGDPVSTWKKYRSIVQSKYGCDIGVGTYTNLHIRCKNCKSMVTCNNQGDAIIETPCEELDPLRPFCDAETNSCSQNNTCHKPVINMICKYSGYFPHPEDCRKFYQCTGKNKKANEITCPKNSMYDHARQMCSHNVKCVTFSSLPFGLCYNRTYHIVPHPYDDSVFVICPPRSSPAQIKTCDSKYERVKPNEWGKCEFICRKEGFFQNQKDLTQFYICLSKENKLYTHRYDCPADSWKDDYNYCTQVQSY